MPNAPIALEWQIVILERRVVAVRRRWRVVRRWRRRRGPRGGWRARRRGCPALAIARRPDDPRTSRPANHPRLVAALEVRCARVPLRRAVVPHLAAAHRA